DRWTWLILIAYTQLRLARAVATDARLPWERPRPQPRLSPYRVRRGVPPPGVPPALGAPRPPARRTEPLGMFLRPAQGPALRACGSSPGAQEARQEAQEQAAQDRKGCLTCPAPSSTTAGLDRRSNRPPQG